MTKGEIIRYINSGSTSAVCVHREVLPSCALIVMSVYISGRSPDCILIIEFDPIDMVDQGEGWSWKSTMMNIDILIKVLEGYFLVAIDSWENVTRTGRLYDFYGDVDNNQYRKEERFFSQDLKFGEVLIPTNVNWVVKGDFPGEKGN